MKKLLYILILAFALPQLSNAQNDYNNQWDLDIHFLALEGTYKTRIANELFWGFSFGSGALFRGNFGSNGFIEIFKFKTLIDYQFSKNFHVYQGLTYAWVFSFNEDDSGRTIGVETGLFLRIWKLEVGVEPSIIFFKHSDEKYKKGVLTTSLLIIKIPLSRW